MLCRNIARSAVLAALTMSTFSGALAEEMSSAAPAERTNLLGDWRGAKTALAARGIIIDVQATQFYQGVVSGSVGSDDWRYGAKGEIFVTLLGEQLGLWKGLIVNAHLEGRVGDDVNALSGLSPANVSMLMPNSNDTIALTQLMAIQMLTPQVAVTAGKFNALDFVDLAFHTGRGVDQFMNTSLNLPIGLAGTVPLGLLGAGALKFKGKEVQGAIVAYDPNNCATTSCLKEPYQDTAVVAVWKFFTGFGPEGKDAGYVALGGTYSNKQYTVVDRESFAFIPGQGLAFTNTDTRWSIFSVVNQQLWSDTSNRSRTLNFKGMYTVTDGKATPIKWSATAALEMNGPISGREKDVLGVGYFHSELSSGFKDIVGPLLSVALGTSINIEDTEGFEAYYKAQLLPWLAVTGDLQVITATLSTEDTKIVTGLRAKVTF